MFNNHGEVNYNDFSRKEKIKKQDKSVSCVYELLNEGQSCKWQNDGTIILNRPASSSLLNKIKFRSFSANIRNDITNTNIPDLSFDLCSRFIHLNKKEEIYRKLRETPSEQNKLYIGNSSGEYVFEGGNGIYDNDINGNIVIETDKINVANGLDNAYNSAVNYSNKQIKSLLGFHLKEEDEDYYNYNSFSGTLLSKYKYLSGVNGLCVGFDEIQQKPIWINPMTWDTELRDTKDYYNLLGSQYITEITEEGDKANNNYKVLSVSTISETVDISSKIPDGMTVIDMSACSHHEGTRLFIIYSDGTFNSFEERRKYNPSANYYYLFVGAEGSTIGPFDITSYIQTFINQTELTGDIYIPPIFGDMWEISDVEYFGFAFYLIGNKPTQKIQIIRAAGTNLTAKFINSNKYISGDITKYPYYGSDYWWLFLCQHFYGFYNNVGLFTGNLTMFVPLLYKEVLGGDYYCQYMGLLTYSAITSETVIDVFTKNDKPLFLMFNPSIKPNNVYCCRYSREGSNKLCYSYAQVSNVINVKDIYKCSDIDYVGVSPFNAKYIEFGDDNALDFQYEDYVFDGTYYYKYKYWSPFYTLSDSKIYYSAGGVLYEPYTPIIVNSTGTTWLDDTHTQDYNYRLIYSENLSNDYFQYDKDNQTINSIRIPVWNQSTGNYGIIEFYLRFYTTPISYFTDPTIKMLPYAMSAYYDCASQETYINGVVVNDYNISDITKIADETYYKKFLLFIDLSNSDQTLKLVCDNYPTLNNIVFYLNETSMVDFKEADSNPAEPNIKCKIIDANDEIITPKNANALYSNITICLDWEFNN